MISSEKLLDALEYLPDDLLEETDALRCRKRVPWVRWAALAACACLAVGLWFFFPGATSTDSACGSIENGVADLEDFSTALNAVEVEVYEVAEDHITVIHQVNIPQPPETDGIHIQVAQIKVTFENLEQIPSFEPGQKIRIYYDELDQDGLSVSPYRIEIIDEKEETP